MTSSVSTFSSDSVAIPGYTIIEQLYTGSRTAVYRAVNTARQQPVVIKVLQREYPSFGELVQFRNQYTIAKNLPISGIVKPLSLEPIGKGYALVMEDWGGVALGRYIQQHPLELADVLAIAIQLADILHDLSQHQVVHKDIKPANILIHPESKQIKLIDFSIASLLSKETQDIQSLNTLEGTLSYLAPEQTGRMNRSIDYRADFYALGVTLYQLLTGILPFTADDPLELVHCHIARMPKPVDQVNPAVPAIVGEIVAKLMAKNAEDRYQNALGLKHDLQQCLTQWQTTGAIAPFDLGQRDLSDRFVIAEKLYGRDAEVQMLLAAFDRVAQGASELMLVAGFSGIGKTAVVHEIHKPITRQQGYFIKGKYDQFNRNIPLSGFVQAFRDLMGQFLTEPDERLAQWKAQILNVVGENGHVLIEVIPELEKIIGKQPPVPKLSSTAAQNRFNLLFPKFIDVFATREHPLVIFLDDLQWADKASLQLIKLLMKDSSYLLMLGAYRDNEVSPTHPFMLTVDELKKAQTQVNTITVSALSFANVNHLIADTLSCSLDRAHPLTELVMRKTQGNPFFLTQFLKTLYEDKLITFNQEQRHWECDIAEVTARSLTHDVVEFMAQQLEKLPAETQQVLKLAACVGNQFDLATLAIVSEQSPTQTANLLWNALQEGLVLPTSQVYKLFQTTADTPESTHTANPCYRFLHDRVQQAAYSLIPEVHRSKIHYRIGRLLLAQCSSLTQATRIFEIVGHLNSGNDLITIPDERIDLAQLNLLAGRKAMSSNAYDEALDYLNQGVELLPENAWTDYYPLTLELHHYRLEAAYLSTQFEEMEAWGNLVLQHTTSILDQIKVYETRIMALRAQGRYQEVVKTGLQVLRLLGIEFPTHPTLDDIHTAYEHVRQELQEKSPLSLLDLPTMHDPQILAAMQILTKLVPSAHIAAPVLSALIILKQVELSIEYGNCPVSIFSYADYGLILCGVMGDISTGYEFGKLSLALLEKLQMSSFKSRAYFIVHSFIYHWKEPLQQNIPHLLEGYCSSLESGDWECVALNLLSYAHSRYWAGQELKSLTDDIMTYRQAIVKVKQDSTLRSYDAYLQTTLNLSGRADIPYHLHGNVFDIDQSIVLLQTTNDHAGLCHAYLNQLFLCYLFEQNDLAMHYTHALEAHQSGLCGFFMVAVYHLYDALIHIRHYSDATPDQQALILTRIANHQGKLQTWATHAPFNHQHRLHMLAAEQARVLHQKETAIEQYDLAIATAQQNGFIQEEALANELAAKFYLDWGKNHIAQEYMTKAYYGYAHWGAKAKVADLEHRYPHLLTPIFQQAQISLSVHETVFATGATTSTSSASSSGVSDSFDLTTILKASQAISSEIELDKLLASLLSIVLENAGATKCILMLIEENNLLIKGAIITGVQPVVLQDLPIEKSQDIPLKLIYKVKHDRQTVVLRDASIDPTLSKDPYIINQHPKSVLCSPIIHQGKLIGILYLENSLVSGAFTADRVELLNLLCAQASISLENAQLYQKMQKSQQLLQLVFDTLPQRVFWKDLESRYLGCNQPFLDDAGLTDPSQLVGKTDFELAWSVNAEEYRAADAEVINTGVPRFNFEEPLSKEDGTAMCLRTSLIPLRDLQGNIIGVFGSYEDITSLKETEQLLKQQKQDLESALGQLQHTQLQMVQNEKMATLGNLVAGVAHEINNPIGFLNGSINNAKDYIQDLFEYLDVYQRHVPPTQPVQDHAEDIDLDFMLEDLPKLLDSMKGATDRIKGISTSLRTFSRADTEHKVSANLHEGIDSTLLILKYRLKANEYRPAIEVIQHYGDLPLVECFPGQLNQVFMNILANAIDIFDEMAQQTTFEDLKNNPQHITIQTDTLPEQQAIEIRIRDNGRGMSAEVKERVFDHLFTTKGVGKGTGLGLAIARQIVVEKHGGRLEVQSELGKGTEFYIWLPAHTEEYIL